LSARRCRTRRLPPRGRLLAGTLATTAPRWRRWPLSCAQAGWPSLATRCWAAQGLASGALRQSRHPTSRHVTPRHATSRHAAQRYAELRWVASSVFFSARTVGSHNRANLHRCDSTVLHLASARTATAHEPHSHLFCVGPERGNTHRHCNAAATTLPLHCCRPGHLSEAFVRTNTYTGRQEVFNPDQIFISPSIKYASLEQYYAKASVVGRAITPCALRSPRVDLHSHLHGRTHRHSEAAAFQRGPTPPASAAPSVPATQPHHSLQPRLLLQPRPTTACSCSLACLQPFVGRWCQRQPSRCAEADCLLAANGWNHVGVHGWDRAGVHCRSPPFAHPLAGRVW
jgi:hypothetical protein